MTDEQVHRLSKAIKQKEAADAAVQAAEKALEAARADRDKRAAAVEKLRADPAASPTAVPARVKAADPTK